MKLSALPSLLRIHNALFGVLSVATSVLLFRLSLPAGFFIVLVFGLISYLTLSAAGNVINDIYDLEIDKINRPGRPLPSGQISVQQAKIVYIILVTIGLASSLYSSLLVKSPIPFIVAVIFVGIGFLYAAKLKAMGFVGNITVGFSFSIGYIYGLLISTLDPSLLKLMAVLLFFMTATTLLISREIIKGIEDIEGDKEKGVQTLAITIGVQKSGIVAALFAFAAIFSYTALLFVGIFKLLLTPFVIAGDISAAFSAMIILFGRKYASKSSLASKIGMFIGLTGFFLASLFI